MAALRRRLGEIFHLEAPPEPGGYRQTLRAALDVLDHEPSWLRPPDRQGRPGGLVMLDPALPTIVVPDLHARMDFFLCVLGYEAEPGLTALDLLSQGRLQIVCLGDGVHAEGRASGRWRSAREEYEEDFASHYCMDEEMRESLGVMAMVMEVKSAVPERFHFLKGNHENITNESGGGNFPFRKFALEGQMVRAYMERFYGEEVLDLHARFEKELPLLASGHGFLLSHAEPAAFYPRTRLVEYRSNPEVVAGLTWTDNGDAEPGSVRKMLDHYLSLDEARDGLYFGGHRPASGGYLLRAEGRYVQIHDPERFVVAQLPATGRIDLQRDVREIDSRWLLAF